MKQIRPLPLKEKYWIDIKKEIERIFDELIFAPLFSAARIPQKELKNAPATALEKAIAKGVVWFEGGKFKGQFSAVISKEIRAMGGQWLSREKAFKYSGTIPAGVSIAAAAASVRYEGIRKSVLLALDGMDISSIDRLAKYGNQFERTIKWANDDFKKAIKGITIAPDLTDEEIGMITADYSYNLDMYVKKWSQESINKMRQIVQDQVFEGRRPEQIAKIIQHEFQVSRTKAQFLARNEAGTLLAKFHEARSRDIGAQYYIWRGALDQRERHDHKLLEGQKIPWDNPPVVDLKTGRRAHAGEDYNCRCLAISVIE